MHESFREDLLHYVWRYQLYDFHQLKTTENLSVTVIRPGILNVNSGPDFSNAKIKIGTKLWYGNVEIHINSEDWYKHGHHNDKAYSNVILHVVYHDNKKVCYSDGSNIPTIVLENQIPKSIFQNYLKINGKNEWVPCEKLLPKLDQSLINFSLHGIAIKRLEQKVEQIKKLYKQTNQDLNQVFYTLIAKSLGGHVNRRAFQKLCDFAPLKILKKYRDQVFLVEAILMGQSGLLPSKNNDPMIMKMILDYQFYKLKHSFHAMKSVEWKFSKMRPAGFPTLRISQLANYVCQDNFWSIYKSKQDIKTLCLRLESNASLIWDTRFHFNKETEFKEKKVGQSMIQSLLINAVLPMMFFYATIQFNDELKEHVLALLSQCKEEKNSISRAWRKLGLEPKNALDTQALYYLKTELCDHSYCLYCPIGNQIMRKT